MYRYSAKAFLLFLLVSIAGGVGGKELWAKPASGWHETYPDFRQLKLLGNVFALILSDYVEVPDQEKLVKAAIDGMLSSLDPHSSFLNARDYGDMKIESRGK